MIEELSAELSYAQVSVRRFLKQAGYYRSYTHNGKWYTLSDIPKFNRSGIWHHQKIGFSRHGNLHQTIGYLIDKSPKGYSAKQLSDILKYPCPAVLTHMYKARMLLRVKHLGQFVYSSADDEIGGRQRKRLDRFEAKKSLTPLSAQAAVFVLVAFIKHPDWSFRHLAAHLKHSRNIVVQTKDIERFFEQHSIKKTPIQ